MKETTMVEKAAIRMLSEGNVDTSVSNIQLGIWHVRRYLFALQEVGAGDWTVLQLLTESPDKEKAA